MLRSHTNVISLTGFALLLIAGACVGTEIGNPQDDESQVSVQARGLELGNQGALTLSSGIEITEAWIVIEEVRLFTGESCDHDLDNDFDTVNVVELISGEEFPGFEQSAMAPGAYCRMEVTIGDMSADDLPEGAPLEMQDRSILIRGRTPLGVDFELIYDSSEVLLLHGLFTLEPGRQALFLVFALEEWLSPDQLDAVEPDDDGTLLISDTNEPDILNEFVDAFLRSPVLIRDENNDGSLQAAELAAPLARGDNDPVGTDPEDEEDD